MRTDDMRAKYTRSGAVMTSGKARVVVAIVAALGFGATARAQLSDDPYFNLFSTGTIYQSDVGATQGMGTSVWLCGTATCAGNHTSGGAGYAEFSIIATQPAGSGYIDPFLRFQHNEQAGLGNSTTEAAYNTDNDALQELGDGGLQFQNQAKDTGAGGSKPPSGDFNHALLFSSLEIDENGFMTFLLDINEPQNTCNDKNASKCALTSTLRLDELEFFISNTNMLSLYEPDWGVPGTDGGNFDSDPSGATTLKFWDMDFEKLVANGRQPNYGGLLLDNINDGLGSAGSGDYDVQVKVPYTQQLADFITANSASGKGDDLYVYLYNFAGEAEACGPQAKGNSDPNDLGDCGEAQAGFEEWAAVATDEPGGPPTGAPIPSTAFLLAAGLLAMARGRKR